MPTEIKDRIQKLVKNLHKSTTYHEEGMKLSVGEGLCALLAADGSKRGDLAKRLHVSEGYLSRIFSGDENLTLTSLAKIAAATNCEWKLELWRRGKRLR